MISTYKFVPPYEANPSPVLIWNAYAPTFNPNAQIEFCTDPLFNYGLTIRERAMFYWHGVYTGDILTPLIDHIVLEM